MEHCLNHLKRRAHPIKPVYFKLVGGAIFYPYKPIATAIQYIRKPLNSID
jgi:hypothetical protein